MTIRGISKVYFDKEKNKESRMAFVTLWADYVRTHTDKEWSKQQNILINSMIANGKSSPLTKEQYLEIKREVVKADK